MKGSGKRYSPELQAEAIRLVKVGRDLADVSRELGVRLDTIRRWIRQADGRDGQSGTTEPRPPAAEEEIRRLRRELELVKEERDFLKKAAAHFAKRRG